MLFGWKRVPPWLHVFSAVAVAVGTAMSAFWILSANSWLQTPAGYELRGGIAYPLDWLEVIFNPSFPYRLLHMLSAAYLTTSLVVLSVGARYLLAGRFLEEGRTMMRMGVGMLALLTPIQLIIGDQHGLNTLEHQPMKIAAVEGHWDGSEPGALVLFAWPDAKAETNRFEIAIPKLGSLIVTHDPDGLFPGLLSVPPEDRPPIVPVFFAFRAMVGVGVLMLLAGWIGAFLWWRGRLFDSRWYLQPVAWGWWLGFVAVVSGWIVTETGRQPWLAHGILRTADATSPVPAGSIVTTLILFVLVYGIVFAMGIYYINRLINKGPEGRTIEPPELITPARPLSTVVDAQREILSPQR
jgi:cytochrome d ubiquinol oxidase subunit I